MKDRAVTQVQCGALVGEVNGGGEGEGTGG
jgi:hypothetical protein